MNRILRTILLILAFLLLAGCSCGSDESSASADAAFRQSPVWTLGERYGADYTQISYFLAYQKGDAAFRLLISRSHKSAGSTQNAIETQEKNGVVCSLVNGAAIDDSNTLAFTLYECYDGQFRYRIGQEKDGFRAEDILSFDEAIALIVSPETPPDGIVLTAREWNAYFRTPSSNLELLICPDDGGALTRSLPSSFSEKTEDGETVYVSSIGDAIVWSDGTSSVEIRQVNRAGAESVPYNTLSECREILALLGSK